MSSGVRQRIALGIAVVCAMVVAGTLGVSTSQAALDRSAPVPPRDRVTASDLPTVRQGARIFSYLRGGSREIFRNRRIDVRADDCISYETGARASDGRWVSYQMANGDSAYFGGKAEPTVLVYKFHTLSDARNAMKVVKQGIRRCEGFHSEDGLRISSREITVPNLGDSRIAYREMQNGFKLNPNNADYFLDVWTRRGRYLINTMLQKDPSQPAKRPAVQLARTALRVAG